MVITVDWARRQGENVSIGERDLNLSARYINGVASPVIPSCTPSQLFVPGIECSSGTITVWTDQGRSIYEGMLLKFQKRLTHRYQFVVSYALQNENTDVGNIWNELNWMAGYGPAQGLPRHNLTVAGSVNLPWGFDLSVNSTIQSRTPFAAQIPNIALSGTDIVGTGANSAQALPGLPYDCLGISCSKSDLAKAVASFNTTYAGTKDSKGNVVPTLVLPTDYQFGDPTFSQDFRLTKVFTIKERWHFNVFGEVFNAFNIANLSGYAFNLDTQAAPGKPQTFTFGQPTSRIGQVFGSGGPRAFQVGARFSF
jgi:hypothetical protein